MTCEIKAGGVYKLPFPFTDLSGKKARPALALNDADDMITVMCSLFLLQPRPLRKVGLGSVFTSDFFAGENMRAYTLAQIAVCEGSA